MIHRPVKYGNFVCKFNSNNKLSWKYKMLHFFPNYSWKSTARWIHNQPTKNTDLITPQYKRLLLLTVFGKIPVNLGVNINSDYWIYFNVFHFLELQKSYEICCMIFYEPLSRLECSVVKKTGLLGTSRSKCSSIILCFPDRASQYNLCN